VNRQWGNEEFIAIKNITGLDSNGKKKKKKKKEQKLIKLRRRG
jgi:hypothetical protein